MEFINPDLEWYTGISKLENVSPRCPYASVYRCPRYYDSLHMMGNSDITTKMKPETIKELDAFWAKTDLLPVVAEHDIVITSSGDRKFSFINFCPEISFDVFGLFANCLCQYADEIDRDDVHSQIVKEAHPNDWRWQWQSISPLHYLKCSMYSQLISRPPETTKEHITMPSKEEMVEVKPSFMGITLNLKVLITKIAKRWLSKQNK